MAARIMKTGMNVSRQFTPETKFGCSVRATTGTFSGIFLYCSADKGKNWFRGHNVEFDSTSKVTDRFDVPDGFLCEFRGAAGRNVEIHIAYLNEVGAHQYAINNHIDGNPV